MATDYRDAIWAPSPNYWSGRNGHAVTGICLHGTAGGGTLEWFQNPQSDVSAHYVVDEDGTVYQCVAERDSAWHNGVVTPGSAFYGGPNPNYWQIGIEHSRNLANDNPMPSVQIDASLALVADILARHGRLVPYTHDQFAIGRICPGPGFPLARFQALTREVITWVRFTATPQHLPLGFYGDASFARLLYWSRATRRTVLRFDGWKRGPAVYDPVAQQDDDRWYRRSNPGGAAGWTPSAWVAGNAPGSTPR